MDQTLNVIHHQPQNQSSSSDSPAGIHCANPDCRTRTGERSRGHQSCRSYLCGHCCQSAAKAAAEAGEQRPICKVHSRRVHTGHRPLPKEPPPQIPVQFHNDQNGMNAQVVNVWNDLNESDLGHELLERRSKLEQSLRRSIMLVVWYHNGVEPLRMPLEVTTFPLFRLSDFPDFIGELHLSPSNYLDTYNSETGQWEQHKISTVRTIEQDQRQRLLYRIRPSLLESLTDCPAMDQEMALQPQQLSLQLKRSADESINSGGQIPPVKQSKVISNAVPVRAPAPPAAATQPNPLIISSNAIMSPSGRVAQPWIPMAGGSLATPISAAAAAPDNAVSNNTPNASNAGSTDWGFVPSGTIPVVNRNRHQSSLPPSTDPNLDPSVQSSSPSMPTRRWPTDFTVHEITSGFRTMAEICSMDPRERQRTAFERVFGCRYVKSTVGRARLYWKRASQEIKDHFLALPPDDVRGKWQNFVHLMDGRLVIEVAKGEGGNGEGGVIKEGEDEERVDEDEETVNASLGYSDPNAALQAHLTQAHLTGAPPQANDQNHSPTGHAVPTDPSLQNQPPPHHLPSDQSSPHAAQLGESKSGLDYKFEFCYAPTEGYFVTCVYYDTMLRLCMDMAVHPGHPLSAQSAMGGGGTYVGERPMGSVARTSSSLSGAIPLPNP